MGPHWGEWGGTIFGSQELRFIETEAEEVQTTQAVRCVRPQHLPEKVDFEELVWSQTLEQADFCSGSICYAIPPGKWGNGSGEPAEVPGWHRTTCTLESGTNPCCAGQPHGDKVNASRHSQGGAFHLWSENLSAQLKWSHWKRRDIERKEHFSIPQGHSQGHLHYVNDQSQFVCSVQNDSMSTNFLLALVR